ncbi:hypothetical protein [Dialister micraerophilus]|uniref:hypothetical protein n=1 Tax=Dialister micraerophilus TaxID=309120 RepID=UPI0023F2557C|nr:hypothetical protein [Dialister micraerophilus]
MNEPIISPWIIYAIDVCNSISEVSVIFSILGIFAIICIFIAMLDRPYEDNSRYKKLLKRLMISTIMFIIVAIIVPDKRVGYTMLATQYITEENVQQAAKMVDRIADKIIRVKNNS